VWSLLIPINASFTVTKPIRAARRIPARALDLFKTCKAGNEYLATVEFLRIFEPEPHFCGKVIRMSVPSPWSVKGVQPKTREAAKDLARREGLTLGEWLNRLIGDVDEDGDVVASRENTPNYAPQAPVQAYQHEPVYAQEAPRTYTQPLAPFPEQPPAPTQNWGPRDSENSRLSAALEQLTRRLDLAAAPSAYAPPVPPPANAYVPTLPNALAERVEASERRSETALGRVDASLSDVRQTQAALAERLRAMEANDPNHKSLAALRGLETALARLSQQVFEVEARSEALEGRIDEKLAEATAKLSQDNGLGERVEAIEEVTKQALETLDTSVSLISQRLASTEAISGDTSARLADAMIDLSARLTGVEQNSDDPTTANQINILGERLAGMEDVTTQAIESVDKGLGLVSQRVAATEALAQATNERLVEALIDLSARLVQLENIDSQEVARDLLNTLEAKNKELTRRLETLDNKIDATRTELTQEVQSAIATGVDGRMAEIAKALADRLDVSERRNGEALEKIGAEMARASISLDQRLREIEERGTDDVAASMRNEMAKMARAIDERMASMERRDATALDQAGGHIQQLAQSLSDKLDASDVRAQSAVQNVSSQMEQLALRLQARQDETAKNLVARMEDGEARSHQELQNSLAQITSEIRSAEDRAKAVAAPLHRDFSALVDRLDQVEASGLAPYTEDVGFGDQSVTIGQGDDYGDSITYDPSKDRGRDAFGSPSAGASYETPSSDDFSFGEAYAPLATEEPPRRQGFGAPFPGTDTSGLSQQSFGDEALNPDTSINFDEDPFSMASTPVGSAATANTDTSAFDFADDMDESWSEPSRTSRGSGTDYLTNARNAAARAAAEKAEVQKTAKKKSALKRPAKAKAVSAQGDKSKPTLSPVVMTATAALVVAGGLLGMNYLNRDKSQNEMPAALTPAPAPVATAEPAPVTEPVAVAPPTTETAPVAAAAAPAATSVAPATPAPVPAPQFKTAIAGETPAPTTTVVKTPARASTTPSPEMRRFVATENAKAKEAAARAQAAQARLKASALAPRAVAPARSVAVPQIATPQNRVTTPTPKTSPSAATTPRTPTPRVAVAGAPRPAQAATQAAGGGNARQLYDQAIARQQAGDAAGAATLMRAAADTGDARSINRLAKMYERGEGVPRDPAQARALTERAASRGSRQAMHNLGVYYAEGEGPQRDLNKAAENFRRAANKGVTDSQFNLGAMAEQGLAGQRSDREAYYWYSVAGRNGDRDAAAKSRELAARLPATEKAAEDQRVASFQAEAGGDD
jgi:localization factor PodJL